MTRRRRAAVLLGLALLLGVLAASDMAGRERALRAQLAPVVGVVVARAPIAAGRRRARGRPGGAPRAVALRAAHRLPQPGGRRRPPGGRSRSLPAPISTRRCSRRSRRRRPSCDAGERALDVVALAPGGRLVPGARVDVVTTADAGGGRAGATRLVLRDAEVLSAGAAPAGADAGGLPRVRASLRVTTGQAVDLAGVLADALQVRLLARP